MCKLKFMTIVVHDKLFPISGQLFQQNPILIFILYVIKRGAATGYRLAAEVNWQHSECVTHTPSAADSLRPRDGTQCPPPLFMTYQSFKMTYIQHAGEAKKGKR